MNIWHIENRHPGWSVRLWRNGKGQYQVTEAGKYRFILENHNYILIHKKFTPAFADLENQVIWHEAIIQDRVLRTVNNDYVELEIFNKVNWDGFEDLEKENSAGLKVWKYGDCVFVSGDLKKLLEELDTSDECIFSLGLSQFVG